MRTLVEEVSVDAQSPRRLDDTIRAVPACLHVVEQLFFFFLVRAACLLVVYVFPPIDRPLSTHNILPCNAKNFDGTFISSVTVAILYSFHFLTSFTPIGPRDLGSAF